jgi:hypothetical protein
VAGALLLAGMVLGEVLVTAPLYGTYAHVEDRMSRWSPSEANAAPGS